MEAENKKFIIIGGGRSGIAAAVFLSNKNADVLLCDTKTYEALVKEGYGIEKAVNLKGVKTVFGRQPSREEIADRNYLILSPGASPDIPPCVTARECGVEIYSEIEFANEFYKGSIIAITGTNGKTTTTTLTGELFKDSGYETYVGGNIGDPFINYADTASEKSVFVLEISSFQLSLNNKLKPKIAVITNITPDHLDRHKTMENYIDTKARVFENMGQNDTVILNYDDMIVRGLAQRAKCNTVFFTLSENDKMGAYLKGDDIIINVGGKKDFLINTNELNLIGRHNAANVMCASLAAYIYGADINSIRQTLKRFQPVEHRMEFVAVKYGVTYINDSKGTNPDASITAIDAIDHPQILIMGGYDKHSSFDEIFEKITQKVKHIIVLGETKDKIIQAAEKCGYKNITVVKDYEQAVQCCREIAREGDYVLLSPACASWDMFENYEVRGRVFKSLVHKL